MNAVEAAQLLDEFTPLAIALAQRFARGRNFLLHDLTSEASFALWRAALDFVPPSDGGIEPFANFARRRIQWALLNRLELERRKNPTAFRPQADEDLDPLALIEARLDVDADASIDAPTLLDMLPGERREILVENIVEGRTQAEIAAARGVSREYIGQIIRGALDALRPALGET